MKGSIQPLKSIYCEWLQPVFNEVKTETESIFFLMSPALSNAPGRGTSSSLRQHRGTCVLLTCLPHTLSTLIDGHFVLELRGLFLTIDWEIGAGESEPQREIIIGLRWEDKLWLIMA